MVSMRQSWPDSCRPWIARDSDVYAEVIIICCAQQIGLVDASTKSYQPTGIVTSLIGPA